MTDTAEDLFDRLDGLPWGNAYRAEADRILALATEAQDLDLEFGARMRLTAYAVMSGVSDLALTHFAWCLAKHKEDPARFAGDVNSRPGSIFWHYKWMPGLLTGSPAFDAEQIDSVLADFEATYRAAALPLSALATARMETAIRMRKPDEAERWAKELKGLPDDAYSSCEACVPSNYVDLDLLQGDDEAAAKRALKMWKKGVSCGDEPETMLANSLMAMVRTGRNDKAVEAFTYVYEQSKGDPEDLGHIAKCVLFAAATGNEERAFTMIERHLGWLAHDALGESEHRDAAASFAVALTRLERAGYGNVVVRGSADPKLAAVLPAAPAPRTIAELALVMWQLAEDLTARFDARNGNDGYALWLAGMRELVDTTYPVELPDGAGDGFRPMLVRRAVPQTPDEWLERAFDHRWAGEAVFALAALSQALPDLEGRALSRGYGLQRVCAGALEDTELEQGATAAWIGAVEAAYGVETAAFARETCDDPSVEDVATALAAHPDAYVGFVAAAHGAVASVILDGDVGEEQLAEAAQQLAEALDLVASIADDPDAHRPLASMLLFSSQIAAARGLTVEALAQIDRALAVAESRTVEAVLMGAKAEFFARAGDLAGAAELHGVAVAVAAAAGHGGLAAHQAVSAGNVLAESGDHEEAAARYAYALSLNPPGETPPMALRWAYALASLNSGDAEASVPMLEQIRDEEGPEASAASIAETHYHLGRAYDATYDDRAADEYLAAARAAQDTDLTALAAVAAYAAGRELHYQERLDEAIDAFELAIGALGDAPDPGLEVDVLLSYAGSLGTRGDDRWLTVADEAIAKAEASGHEALIAKAHFVRLSLLDDRDAHDRVIALADDVSARMLAIGDTGRAAAAVHWKASALLATERFDEAMGALAAAAKDETHGADEREVFASRLAGTYAEAGRKAEASQWKSYLKQLKKS